jgi:hypothetical protein
LAEDVRKTSFYVCDEKLWLTTMEENNSTPSSQLGSEKIFVPVSSQINSLGSSNEGMRPSRKTIVIDKQSSGKVTEMLKPVRKPSFNTSCPEIKSLTNFSPKEQEAKANFSKIMESKPAKIYSSNSFGLQRIESRISAFKKYSDIQQAEFYIYSHQKLTKI